LAVAVIYAIQSKGKTAERQLRQCVGWKRSQTHVDREQYTSRMPMQADVIFSDFAAAVARAACFGVGVEDSEGADLPGSVGPADAIHPSTRMHIQPLNGSKSVALRTGCPGAFSFRAAPLPAGLAGVRRSAEPVVAALIGALPTLP
jgi:hypothetical protein